MNILLLNPPRFNELVGKNPSVIEHNRGYNPPLGLLSLATNIEQMTSNEFSVSVLDCQPTQMTYEDISNYFRNNEFDLVGITAMTFTLIDVISTVKIIKSILPNCIIVLGGSHVHLFPDETLNLSGIDYLVLGEGEYTFVELLKAITEKRELSEICGIAYKKGNKVINNGVSKKINDLDKLHFPDRRFLPLNHYNSLLAQDDLITTMFTSRGCPFQCKFCDRPTSPINNRFRWRSAKNVVDEIEDCYQLGIKEILIYDDTFTVKKNRVLEICDEILSRGLKIKWDVRAHVNTMDLKILKMMNKAGCKRIHYGVECGNDRMLKVINKKTNIKTIKRVFKETKNCDIETLAYFMIGNYTETISDINDTMKLAKTLKPDFCHFTIFCPYPGTEMYRLGLEKGIIRKDVWREFAKSPDKSFKLPVWEENFTRTELYELVIKCYKSFYLRPHYMIKKAMSIKSFGEFKRKIRAGLSVCNMKAEEVDKLNLHKAIKVK